MSRFTLKLGDHLESAKSKKIYNEKVFSEIAPRYDFITKALSFGHDKKWKENLLGLLPNMQSPSCLDLACGTGDIAFLLAQKYPDGSILGLDIAQPMLDIAEMRNCHSHITFQRHDMSTLKLKSGSIDIVTGGYALRNAPDLPSFLNEIYRVLRAGGFAAFLDFSKPENALAQRVEYYVLKFWTGFWGIFFHGNHEVYSYIAESLWRYPSRSSLKQALEKAGFCVREQKLYFFGVTALILIQKSDQ